MVQLIQDMAGSSRQAYHFRVDDLTMEEAMEILRELHRQGHEAESVVVR